MSTRRVAILYAGNIDPKLSDWNTIASNHFRLFSILFHDVRMCDIDIFFVVDETDFTSLLRNTFYKARTKNVVCTSSEQTLYKTTVNPLGRMDESYIEMFQQRIRDRGFDPNKIFKIENVEQFHKLAIAIRLKREEEARMDALYDVCVKLRPDTVFHEDSMHLLKEFATSDKYFAHLHDLFFITSSKGMDTLENIPEEIYTHDEAIVEEYEPDLDGTSEYGWHKRLFPETQLITIVSKHSPHGKYDSSWNFSNNTKEHMDIVRYVKNTPAFFVEDIHKAGYTDNPIDDQPMVWMESDFTDRNYPGLDFQKEQKRNSLDYVLKKGRGVLDVGAHLGDYGIPLAVALKRLNANIHVYCIDPSMEKCQFMRYVSLLNGLTEKEITIINCGISDQQGRYSVAKHGVGSRRVGNKNTGSWYWISDPKGTPFTTLDSLWSNNLIGEIGFFWLDAQWMEPNVLRGGVRYLEHCKPYILIEYDKITQYNFDQVSIRSFTHGNSFEELESDPNFKDFFDYFNVRYLGSKPEFDDLLIEVVGCVEPTIPKIVHKVLIQHDMRLNLDARCEFTREAHDSWRDSNPDYEIRYYSGADCREFLAKHFEDPDVLATFDGLNAYSLKCDFFRYCLLYKVGGFYTDWKMVLHRPLKEWIARNKELVCSWEINFNNCYGNMCNGFIGSVPNAPVLKKAIDMAIKNVKKYYYGNITLDITGSGVLGRAFAEHHAYEFRKEIDEEHLLIGLHMSDKGTTRIDFKNQKVITVKHPRLDQSPNWSQGNNYDRMWHTRTLFKHHKIDKTIHKVLIRDDMVLDLQNMKPSTREAHLSWSTSNPNYQIRYYSGHDCRQFLQEEYDDPEILDTYDALELRSNKTDFFVYCLLNKTGGIYSGWNTLSKDPIDEWVSSDKELVCCWDALKAGTYGNVSTSFVGSVPNSPVLKTAIRMVIDNLKRRFRGNTSADPTGSGLFGKAFASHYTYEYNKEADHKELLLGRSSSVLDDLEKCALCFKSKARLFSTKD